MSPPPRVIPLQGQPNFRDLGGYCGAQGKTVAHGKVFRSGDLASITDEDLERIAGIKTVVDFRTEEEIQGGANRLPVGARLLTRTIDSMETFTRELGEDQAIERGRIAYLATYREIVDRWRHIFAEVLELVEDPANLPLVFHCTHGKDRTGIAAAVVLTALGVEWADVEYDYLHSNACRREINDAEVDRVRQWAAQRRGVAPSSLDETWLRSLFYVEPAYLDAAHQQIVSSDATWGAYLASLGFDSARLERLRAHLLEG